jgi:hypothetical protein
VANDRLTITYSEEEGLGFSAEQSEAAAN